VRRVGLEIKKAKGEPMAPLSTDCLTRPARPRMLRLFRPLGNSSPLTQREEEPHRNYYRLRIDYLNLYGGSLTRQSNYSASITTSKPGHPHSEKDEHFPSQAVWADGVL
jgi:hypothetical protein